MLAPNIDETEEAARLELSQIFSSPEPAPPNFLLRPKKPDIYSLNISSLEPRALLFQTLKNALGTSGAASLNTAIFIFLISIANGMEGNPDAIAYIATVQAICVVPFAAPLYASSAAMSIARGRNASQTVINSIKRAANKLALEMTVPQIIALITSFLLTYTFSDDNAALTTRKFISIYAFATPCNNLTITNQETFMANSAIKQLTAHNAIYLASAVSIFSLLHLYKPLTGWASGISFALSSITAKVTGDAILHWKNPDQVSLFNTYSYDPQLVKKFYKSIKKSGVGVLAQLGVGDLAILSVLLSSNLSIAAALANGPCGQFYSLITVILFQAIQSITAEFIARQHGDFLEQVKIILRRDPDARINTEPAQQHMNKIILMSGFIIMMLLLLITSIIGGLLKPISTLLIHEDTEQYDEAMDLIAKVYPYTATAGIAATLTEFLNAVARKTDQHEIKDNWIQGGLTAFFAILNIILIITDSIDFKASWQLFMVAPILRLIYQGYRAISSEINYKELAKYALTQVSLSAEDSLAHSASERGHASPSPHFAESLQERLSPPITPHSVDNLMVGQANAPSPSILLEIYGPPGTRSRNSKEHSPDAPQKAPAAQTAIYPSPASSSSPSLTRSTVTQDAWSCRIC